jgi:hypothetical protein
LKYYPEGGTKKKNFLTRREEQSKTREIRNTGFEIGSDAASSDSISNPAGGGLNRIQSSTPPSKTKKKDRATKKMK